MTDVGHPASDARSAVPDVASPPRPDDAGPDTRATDLAALRHLLVGAEQARLNAIEARLAAPVTPDAIATRLPEAITLRATQDRALAVALAPTIEGAISESVRRRPNDFADAIFPVLGPAIRKAIAGAMNELAASINSALQHSFSLRGLKWRVEAWRSGVPYAQVVIRHALVYRVEQVFLIHRDTGLLLEQANLPGVALPDADLVSGMLTAIRDFVADSFQQERESGGLRAFSVGELSVIVEPGPDAMLAAVVRGQAPPDYSRRLVEAIESVHAQYGSALREFTGDTAPFGAARPLLDDCLLSVLETDRSTGGGAVWKPWVAAFAVCAIALLAWRLWTAAHWRRATAALAETPGLVVIDGHRGWRSAAVRGLRDPDAPDPSRVLAAAGLDTTRVTQMWEPYLSLRPPLVLRRLRRSFGAGAPPDSQLSMRGDTLVLTGRVQAAWRAQLLRDGPGRVPGMAAVAQRDVTLELPAVLAATRDSVTQETVLFAAGDRGLASGAAETVQRVARLLNRLEAELEPLRARAVVALVGRADPVGRDSTNRALSQERAATVLQALEVARAKGRSPDGAGGTPVALSLTATGVGSTDPLTVADTAARARINRSVSFTVRVVPESTASSSPP